MRSIQRLLGLDPAATDSLDRETETIRRVGQQLEQLPADQARYVAGFAYILARLAHVDLEISDAEYARIETLVASEGGVGASEAALIAQIVRYQAVNFGGTEDYRVTRGFAEHASREQCLALVRCLYQVAAADQGISAREDGQIRQIANELRLTHPEVIALRSRFRDQLNELKNDEH